MSNWRIRLLGGLQASRGGVLIERLPSRAVTLLLLRLALPPLRRHAREELVELLWPGVAPAVGRNRLRQALSTLRRLFEPPDLPPGSVLYADRLSVALHAGAFSCDVAEFERLLREGGTAAAIERYGGELMPGLMEDWVEDERLRLAALYERARARPQSNLGVATAAPQGVAPQGTEAAARPPAQVLLPCYASSFFGREREQEAVREALSQARLVTLTGLGGFGKTRLAVECARAAEGFATRAFVPLADCTDARGLLSTIREALGMESGPEDVRAQLLAFLGNRKLLLVLDNFEQLVNAGTPVLLDLLERLPGLSCLVSSRRALAVPGERGIALTPLPVPEPTMALADAAATPGLALLVDRARGARADFALTEDNRAALIDLCRALEGLPLAIEIAASRIRSFSPAEMRAALGARFDLLRRQGPRGARYGRHASLQATIDWSWQLLGPQEQEVFANLAVLRGSWTASVAAVVLDRPGIRDQLDALVADSLLGVASFEPQGTRFFLLETLREFAVEQLAPDRRQALRRRHREVFLHLAQALREAEDLPAEQDWPNFREALASAVADQDADVALALALALEEHWQARGAAPEELRLLETALAQCPATALERLAGLDLLARLNLNLGHLEAAQAHARQAVASAGGDPARRARALITQARTEWEREPTRPGLLQALDEALRLAQASGHRLLAADAWRVKATITLKHGSETANHAAADLLFRRAERLYLDLSKADWTHRVRLSRVGCLTGLRRYREAGRLLEQVEQHFAERGSVADLVAVANMRGYLESGQDHWAEAAAAGRRGVRLAWEHHAHLHLTLALWNLPHALVMLGEAEGAARLMGFAAAFWQRVIGPLAPADQATVAEVQALAARKLPRRTVAALFEEGSKMSLARAVLGALRAS